jgi:hypothetical protein
MQDQREKDLVTFKSHFDDVTFRKGMDLRLALSSDGSVTTVVDGAKVCVCACVPSSLSQHRYSFLPYSLCEDTESARHMRHKSWVKQ